MQKNPSKHAFLEDAGNPKCSIQPPFFQRVAAGLVGEPCARIAHLDGLSGSKKHYIQAAIATQSPYFMKKKVVHNRVIIQIPELHFFFRYLLSRYFNSGLLPLFLTYKKTAKFQKKAWWNPCFYFQEKVHFAKMENVNWYLLNYKAVN